MLGLSVGARLAGEGVLEIAFAGKPGSYRYSVVWRIRSVAEKGFRQTFNARIKGEHTARQ